MQMPFGNTSSTDIPIQISKQYYALLQALLFVMQYSKFIKSGWTILDTSQEDKTLAAMYQHQDFTTEITVVTTNTDASSTTRLWNFGSTSPEQYAIEADESSLPEGSKPPDSSNASKDVTEAVNRFMALPQEQQVAEAFQKRCLAALACMEIAQSLCKAEDDRLFATICMNKIVAVLDKQPAAMQMQRHKLGLPLEATRGEQISTGFPKSCNAQVTPEAELRSALDVEKLRFKSILDEQQIVTGRRELAEAKDHADVMKDMLDGAQAEKKRAVQSINRELREAKAACSTLQQQKTASEVKLVDQQRNLNQILRQVLEQELATNAWLEQQVKQPQLDIQKIEQLSQKADHPLAERQKYQQALSHLQVEKDQITAHLEQQLQRLHSEVSSNQKHSDRMTAKLAAKHQAYTEALQQLGQKGAAIAEMKERLQSATVRIHAAELATEKVLAQKAALQADCEALRQSQHSAVIAELKEQLQQAAAKLRALEQGRQEVMEGQKALHQLHAELMATMHDAEAPPDVKATVLKAMVQEDEAPADSEAASPILALHDVVTQPIEAQQASSHIKRGVASPPGLCNSKILPLEPASGMDPATASTQQDLGSLDKPQVIKAMKQGPALRNPVPKPSLVKAPPGLAGKAKPFSQVADTARDLHTSRQEGKQPAGQASAVRQTRTASQWGSDLPPVKESLGLRKASGYGPSDGVRTDEWAFVGTDGRSYGVLPKAMVIALWKKKKLLAQTLVHHASEEVKKGQQLHRFHKQWKESGELPSRLAMKELDVKTAYTQLRVLDRQNT
ncbi:hypothetical protein ABBQ38_000524 [Trebouxia sp. C0009 RCD-2024]